MKKLNKDSKNAEIVKTPQELIHIEHRITLHQYKCWLLMLRFYREIYESTGAPDKREFCRIQTSKLQDWIGYKLVTSSLKQDLEAIRKEPIIFNALNKDGKDVVRGSGFISEWEISGDSIGFKLPDFLCDSIEKLDLNNAIFLKLNWSIFNSFAGKYEAIIYKLCKDYIGVRKTPVMSIDSFRDYVGLTNDEYSEFNAFSRYVIRKPVQKINESLASDILIVVDFKRNNVKKVVSVQFLIEPKYQSVCDMGDDPAFRYARITIPLSQQAEYLLKYKGSEIEASIERANEYIDKMEKDGTPIISIGSVYRKAMEENWGEEYQVKKEKDNRTTINSQVLEIIKNNNSQEDKINSFKIDYVRINVVKAMKEMDAAVRNAWVQIYANESGKNKISSYDPEKMDFSDKTEKSFFNIWLRTRIAPSFDNDAFIQWVKETKGVDLQQL